MSEKIYLYEAELLLMYGNISQPFLKKQQQNFHVEINLSTVVNVDLNQWLPFSVYFNIFSFLTNLHQ